MLRNEKLEELIKDQPVAITLPYGIWLKLCLEGKASPELDKLQDQMQEAFKKALNEWREGIGDPQ